MSLKSLYKVDDAVFAKNFGQGTPWVEGKIIEVLGVRNYKVQLRDFGKVVWKRHADQLMSRFVGNFAYNQANDHSELVLGKSVLHKNPCPSVSFEYLNVPVSKESVVVNDTVVNNEVINNEPPPVSVSGTPTLRRSSRTIKPPDRLTL